MSNLSPTGTPDPTEGYASRASALLQANPGLAREPGALNVLVNHKDVPAHVLGGATNFLSQSQDFKDAAQQHANTVPHASGWWGDVTDFGSGLFSGAKSLAEGAIGAAKRAASSVAEFATGGAVGNYGLFHFSQNLHDMSQNVTDVSNYVNPVTDWRLLGRTNAYWKSQQNRRGNAYTAGELLPQFIASLLGGSALDTAGVTTDSAAVDAANLAKIEKLAQDGRATPDQFIQRESILARQARKQLLTNQSDAGIRNLAENVAARGKAFANAFNTSDKVSRWLPGLAVKGVSKVLGDQAGGLRTNLFYGATAAHAASSPENQALWNDPYVQQGIPIDIYGRPEAHSFGQSLANSLDLHAGSLYDFASHAAQYGQFAATEPFGLGLGLKGMARAAEGAGGVLGKWWTGVGVESPGDVIRTANATPGATRAYQYMADHGLSDIKKTFPRMYTDEQYKWLSQAKSFEDVVNIHADIASGVGLTRHVAPSLGVGRFFLSKTREGLMAWQKASESFSQLEDASKTVLEHYGVVDFKPTSATEAASDSLIRTNATFRRWVAKSVTRRAMHVVEADSLAGTPYLETQVLSSTDRKAVNALVDAFKGSGVFNDREIATLADTLHALPAGADMTFAATNLISAMFHGAISRFTDTATMESVNNLLDPLLQDHVERMFGMKGGGQGLYINGLLGHDLSVLRDPTDATKIGSFGIAQAHIGNIVIPDPRYIARFVKAAATAITKTVGSHEALLFDLHDLEATQNAAEFSHASLQGVPEKLTENVARRSRTFANDSADEQAYRRETADISSQLNAIKADKSLTAAEAFSRGVVALQERMDQYATELASGENKVLIAKMMASRDALNELKSQIVDLGMSDAQIHEVASRIADVSGETGDARAALRDATEANLKRYRDSHGDFTSKFNHTANAINHLLSKWFVPLMLSTGGYITRITGSEVLLNIARMGSPAYIQARLSDSIAKMIAQTGRDAREAPYIAHTIAEQISHLVGGVSKTLGESLKGTAAGAYSGIAKAIDREEFGRLIDHAVELRSLHSALPDLGHATSQLYGESSFRTGSRQMTYGVDDKNGVRTPTTSKGYRGNTFVGADGSNNVTALRDNMVLISGDPKLKGSIESLQKVLKDYGVKPLTHTEFNEVWDKMTQEEYKRLMALPEYEKAAMRSSVWPIADNSFTTGDPIMDYAKRISYNTLSVVSGPSRLNEYIFHRNLISMMAEGKIPPSAELSKIVEKMGGSAPRHLITSNFQRFPWQDGLSKWAKAMDAFMNLPTRLNSMLVDSTFGHLISWASREPVYLWAYHTAMDSMAEKVSSGVLSHSQAMVEAQNSAFHELIRFVHNPADRYIYESHTRAYAPFWFAKNQMYRRGLRLLEEDPHAFYEYMRYSMLATVGVAQITKNGAPAWLMPFGDVPASIVARLVSLFPSGLPRDVVGFLGFALAGSGTSFASVLPTGTELPSVPAGSPWYKYIEEYGAQVGSLMKPDSSALVSVPLKLGATYGMGNSEWYDKTVKAILGPIGAGQGIGADLLPSTFYRGAATAALGGVDLFAGASLPGPIIALQVKAHQAMLDNWTERLAKQYDAANLKPGEKPSQQYLVTRAAWVEFELSQLLNNQHTASNLMDASRGAALGLYIARLAAYFPSPVSVYLKETFSKAPEFDKYLKMKGPDGQPLSFSEAMTRWSINNPGHMLDMVSHYQSPDGVYPETQAALDWLTKAHGVVTEYPNVIPLFLPQTGKYVPQALLDEISTKMRIPDTPQEYANAVQVSLGDSFYYNYLEPEFYRAYGTYFGPDNPKNTISYEGYRALSAAAQNYARTSNLAWSQYGSPLSLTAKARQTEAVTRLGAFLSDKSAISQVEKAGLLTSQEITTAKEALDWYTSQVNIINTLKGSARYAVEQQVYETFTHNATVPGNEALSQLYLVLAKTPTKNSTGG